MSIQTRILKIKINILICLFIFKTCFDNVNRKFDRIALNQSIKSGSTACVCFVEHTTSKKLLHIAWCGDSQFCLIKNGQLYFITEPHKPNSPNEKDRIEMSGGFVACVANTWRINGTLAVSRSFGDIAFQTNRLVIAEPDVKTIELDGTEDYFIMGCDGLFEFIDYEKDLLYQFIDEKLNENSENIAEILVNRAKENGSTDNITCIFVKLNY